MALPHMMLQILLWMVMGCVTGVTVDVTVDGGATWYCGLHHGWDGTENCFAPSALDGNLDGAVSDFVEIDLVSTVC